MKFNEEKLKNIYEKSLSQTSIIGENCIKDDVLLRAVIDKQSSEYKFKIIDHVFECGYCTQRFNAIRQFYKETKELTKDKENIIISKPEVKELIEKGNEVINSYNKEKYSFSNFSGRYIKYISAIAALLLIIIGSILFIQSPKELININNDMDKLRGENKIIVKLISPKGDFNQHKLIFKWHSVKDSKEYIVKLYNEELTSIWTSSKIEKTNHTYPSQLFNKMKKGDRYFWRVIVYTKDNEIIKSKLSNFKIIKKM